MSTNQCLRSSKGSQCWLTDLHERLHELTSLLMQAQLPRIISAVRLSYFGVSALLYFLAMWR